VIRRRDFLAVPLWLMAGRALGADGYPAVVAGTTPAFPRDHASHPEYRTEWWYVTGWLRDGGGAELGFQVTFFRNRPRVAEDNPSRFAARELVFAHAALADPRYGRLRHDERAARSGFGLAGADTDRARVWIDDWSLELAGETYAVRVRARDFTFDLRFASTQPILLHGDGGVSRKGRDPLQASWYYSRPQLAVTGTVESGNRKVEVKGRAWLDHEWSSEILGGDAIGWDWVGLNLDDGGALMAFRMRGKSGSVPWAGGTLRTADGRTQVLPPSSVRFTPTRYWRSPRTDVKYPIAWTLVAGSHEFALEPLFDDQELDARASTGTIYWEGAVRALQEGRVVGHGYLELTGYWRPLKL
jgi:predicted secreted hydrolase